MMIAALMLAATAKADAYDAVLEAQSAAMECERNHLHNVSHAYDYLADAQPPPLPSAEELSAVCSSSWDKFKKARLTYHARYGRSMRRLVPGFRPDLEICWQAFHTEIYRWPGMPDNTALRDCKNAKN